MDRAVAHGNIFTHTSLAGRDDGLFHNSFGIFVISTHTSLAGRDRYILFQTAVASLYVGTDKSDIHNYINFNW